MNADHTAGAGLILLCPTCLTSNPVGTVRCDSCFRVLSDLVPEGQGRARSIRADRRRRRRRRMAIKVSAVLAVLICLASWQLFEFYGLVRFKDPPVSRVSASPIGPEDTAWPMFQRDPSHSGYAPSGDLSPVGEVVWSFEMGTPLASPPAVADGKVYLGAGRRGVIALDAHTGDLLWQYAVRGQMKTAVAVAGAAVYAGLRDGRVVALEAGTGEVLWEVQTGNKVFSSPTVFEGAVYVGSGDSHLYVIDAVTGEIRWKYRAGDSIISSPAVTSEALVFTSQDKKLYVVETFSGKLRFDYRLDYVAGSPIIRGDRVYVGDESGVLRSIDWHQRTLPFERAFAKLRFYGWWYGLASLDNQKGFVWGFSPAGSEPLGTAVATEDLVLVPDKIGRLHAVDIETGEEVWSFRATGRIQGAPAVVGDTALMGDSEGRIYGIRTSTGEPLWEIKGLGGPLAAAPIVADGTIYAVTENGRLLAIR